MPTPSLERRLDALEASLQPPKPRRVVLVKAMARDGHVWVPRTYSVGSVSIERRDDESPDAFERRVADFALASSDAPVTLAIGVAGQEIPATLAAQMWPNE